MGKFLTSLLIAGLSFTGCSSPELTVAPEGMVSIPGGYYAAPNIYNGLEFVSRVYLGYVKIEKSDNGGIVIRNLDLDTPVDPKTLTFIAGKADKDNNWIITEEEAVRFIKKYVE